MNSSKPSTAPPQPRSKPVSWFRQQAREYVDAQLATMEKYGSAPILSVAEYYSLVDEMQAIGEKLWTRTGGKIRR